MPPTKKAAAPKKAAAKKLYTEASVHRALTHHESTGAIHSVSPPGQGQPKWRVRLTESDDALELTLHEAYVLCLALAHAERRWRKVSVVQRPTTETGTGWPTELPSPAQTVGAK